MEEEISFFKSKRQKSCKKKKREKNLRRGVGSSHYFEEKKQRRSSLSLHFGVFSFTFCALQSALNFPPQKAEQVLIALTLCKEVNRRTMPDIPAGKGRRTIDEKICSSRVLRRRSAVASLFFFSRRSPANQKKENAAPPRRCLSLQQFRSRPPRVVMRTSVACHQAGENEHRNAASHLPKGDADGQQSKSQIFLSPLSSSCR